MSVSPSDDAGDSDGPIGEMLDRKEWHDLDADEREEILESRLEDRDEREETAGGGGGEGEPAEFEHAEMEHSEKMNTMAAIARMAEGETWTATVLGDIEIEFRCMTNERADRYRAVQDEIAEAQAEVEEFASGADDDEEIDAEALSELDKADEIEGRILDYVEEATAEEWLTREWLETAEYPERLVGQLMGRIRQRINNRGERIEKFQ